MSYEYKRRIHALVDLDEVTPGLFTCPEAQFSQSRLQQTIEKLAKAVTDYGKCMFIAGTNAADGICAGSQLESESDKKFKKIFKVLGLCAPESRD